SEETRSSRLIPGQRRASTTNARHAQSTLKEGAHHMKRLSLFALAVALVLAISAWAPAPAAAQTPVQRGRTLDLIFISAAGTTNLSFGATYPFSFILDGTLNYKHDPIASQLRGQRPIGTLPRNCFPRCASRLQLRDRVRGAIKGLARGIQEHDPSARPPGASCIGRLKQHRPARAIHHPYLKDGRRPVLVSPGGHAG